MTFRFKTLLTTALLSLSLVSNAGWLLIKEARDSDTKLLADTSSYFTTKLKDGTEVIGASFMYNSVSVFTKELIYVTTKEACDLDGGIIAHIEADSNKNWSTKNKYYWIAGGTHMYDAAGQILCEVYKVKNAR
jgi:hypothetical protein